MRPLFLFALLCAVGAPVFSHAQLLSTEAISLSLSPEYPRPYDTVIVTPRSTQINLAAAAVTVSVNGTIIEEGSGERGVPIMLQGPGSSTNVRVSAVLGGETYTSQITLRPADVSLVMEPQTTTHPLFEGGALVAPESSVRLVAFTDFRTTSGSRIPSSSLSYVWRVGNRILTNESGLGRSVLTATAPVRYRSADVSVTVSTSDDSMVGYAKINVAPATPKLLAYVSDPLLGPDFAHALSGSFLMNDTESSFLAVPFFYRSLPNVSWNLNGSNASSDATLTVRRTDENVGKATVSVSASDTSGERASSAFTILFGRPSSLFTF